ncbi:MAG: glycerol-3-phosphate acyltransferase, partial [Rhodospirillales bacterium]
MVSPGAAIAIVAILSYLLGSIPFGLLLTRIAGLGDIRDVGSGNVGATNVLRTGAKGIAAATLILDAAKGAAPVLALAFWQIGHADLGLLAGLAAVIGHNFPVWLKFKGGKGVATSIGV